MPSHARASAATAASAAAALLLLLLFAAGAEGHAIMVQPPSRNWLAYLRHEEFRPHELSMGGARVVSDNGNLRYPAGRRGGCGDRFDAPRYAAPGPVRAAYRAGQTVNVDVALMSNHAGRFAVQVCDLMAGRQAQAQGRCYDLRLAASPNPTRFFFLPNVRGGWGGGNWGGDEPSYGDGTFSAYPMPAISSGWGCTNQATCDSFRGMWVYRTQWQLPGNFTCEHCKLQWTWTTGHNCWPTCDAGDASLQCTNRQPFPACGQPGAGYPEEFVNCADISVSEKADPAASNSPPWGAAVAGSMRSGLWGTVRPPVMSKRSNRDRRSRKAWAEPEAEAKAEAKAHRHGTQAPEAA
ncbi:hypothetical protein Rsub_05177 [Raphidocelis subcapitata]|uniref:Uncharacterized protein n=1 Tax=Raphidocelis subcapitata TaxID=307507 RepID=A0A2V0P3Y5_9CHLO|nr:hypothetical protein Rsub_05177 [Raphidocelis subcapitata]|eukprot:GBF92563.1 hypothetical protein Rsub_05177 [Raphidocelis subcapitata]